MTGQTIRLQPGDYRWSDAPTYRVPEDCLARIGKGVQHFARYAHFRAMKMTFNAVTGGALVEHFTGPGDPPPPAGFTGLSIYGIPAELDPDLPTGVIRLSHRSMALDIDLNEPAEAEPPASWDPTPKWQRDHQTQWWGTYGNPLLRPTGI